MTPDFQFRDEIDIDIYGEGLPKEYFRLVPYKQRIDNAVIKLLESQPWDREQQRWLMRIGKQFKENVIIDRTTFDTGAFSECGGFPTLNKVFDGKLEDILGGLIDSMWQITL